MFAFLDQVEFARLARCSADFLQAASWMSSRRWQVACHHPDRLDRILSSPLRRHVGALDSLIPFSHDLLQVRLVLPPAILVAMADRMAHVERLKCEVALKVDMPTPRWPPQLRILHLQLHAAPNLSQPKGEVAPGDARRRVARHSCAAGRRLHVHGEVRSPLP